MSKKLVNTDGTPILVNGEEVWTMDAIGKIGSVDVDSRKMRIIGTDETVDRDGDIITVKGWELDNYKKNPVFLWAHDYRSVPLARTDKLVKRKDPMRYEFHVRYPTLGLYPFADMILSMYGEQMINASSVGFIPKKWEKIDEEGERAKDDSTQVEKGLFWHEPRRYLLQELLELSGCPVPSNPNALTPDALGQRSFGGIPAAEMFKWIQESQIPQPKNMDDILEEIECTPLIIEDKSGPLQVQVPEKIEDSLTDSASSPKLNRRVDETEVEEETDVDSPELIELDIKGPFETEFLDEELIELEEVLKPYPNEHACRLKPPNYPKYARKNCYRRITGKCVDFIFGIKGPKKSELQAMRFKKDTWTVGAAKKVCSARGGSFEPAKEPEFMEVKVNFDPGIELEKNKLYLVQLNEDLTFDSLEVSPEEAKHPQELLKRLIDALPPTEDSAGQVETDDQSKKSEGEGAASTILDDAFKEGEVTRTPQPESPSLQDRLKSPGGQELIRELKRLNNTVKKLFGR